MRRTGLGVWGKTTNKCPMGCKSLEDSDQFIYIHPLTLVLFEGVQSIAGPTDRDKQPATITFTPTVNLEAGGSVSCPRTFGTQTREDWDRTADLLARG